jgi:hypothetical protein
MVSIRCKLVVKSQLERLGINYRTVDLGEVEVIGNLNTEQLDLFGERLLDFGLELLDDKKGMLIEKIKKVVIESIHYDDELPRMNFSDYLNEKLTYDYTYMSNLFSEATGITLEHYIIANKIEKVKELLIYDEMSLTEISYKMNYSSIAHLSSQFKKITGLTPSFFKQLKQKRKK